METAPKPDQQMVCPEKRIQRNSISEFRDRTRVYDIRRRRKTALRNKHQIDTNVFRRRIHDWYCGRKSIDSTLESRAHEERERTSGRVHFQKNNDKS